MTVQVTYSILKPHPGGQAWLFFRDFGLELLSKEVHDVGLLRLPSGNELRCQSSSLMLFSILWL